MKRLFSLLLAVLCLLSPAFAGQDKPPTADQVMGWIKQYRDDPTPMQTPAVARALSVIGGLQEPESSGVYVGFFAGILAKNPKNAPKIAGKMADSVRPEDQWAVVRAIAWSGHPNWRGMLEKLKPKLAARQVMIDAFLAGELPRLQEFTIPEPPPTAMQRFKGAITFNRVEPETPRLAPSPAVMDAFWGYYYATNDDWALEQIVAILPWSADGNHVDRLTIGSTAKYSLASNAARDPKMLKTLKSMQAGLDDETGPIMAEIITAAETMEMDAIRKQALASIEEIKAKGPAYQRKIGWWGSLGEGALSLGCITAAATGQVYLGVPCVIGGAVTSGALRYFSRPG